MSAWILLIWVSSGVVQGGIALEQVEFRGRDKCLEAGYRTVEAMKADGFRAGFTCNDKGAR